MPLRLRAAALLLLVGVGGIDSKLQRWYRDNTAVWTPPGEIAVIAKVAESAPIETPGPSSPFVNWHLELARRDNPPDDPSPTLSDPVSPGQTCGTVRAHGLSPVQCPPFQACMATSAFSIGQVGCCDLSGDGCGGTPFYVDCIDATDAPARSGLTEEFTGMLTCSDTASPSCGQYIGVGSLYSGYTMFYCAPTGGKVPVEWDFANATTGTDDATSIPGVFVSLVTATGSAPNATGTDPTQVATTQDNLLTPTATGNSAVDKDQPTPSKPRTGAIVGGIIGGIAFVGVVILAIILAVRRHKGQHQRAESPPPTPPAPPYDGLSGDKQPQVYNHIMPGQQPTIPDIEEVQHEPLPPTGYYQPGNIPHHPSYVASMVTPPENPPPGQESNSFVYQENVFLQMAVAVHYQAYPPPIMHRRSNRGAPVRAGTPIPELSGDAGCTGDGLDLGCYDRQDYRGAAE